MYIILASFEGNILNTPRTVENMKNYQDADCKVNLKCILMSMKPDKYCILHDPDPKKNISIFYDALFFLIFDSGHDFLRLDGIFFPSEFEFWMLWTDKKTPPFVKPRVIDCALFLENVHFLGSVNFSTITFNRKVYLSSGTFSGEALFNDAIFNDEFSFFNVTFEGLTNFINTTFNEKTVFYHPTFRMPCDFRGSNFKSSTSFSNGSFMHDATFDGVIFEGDAYFSSSFEGIVSFSRAYFFKQEFIHFYNVDFRRCILLNTDIRGIDFSMVRWGEAGRWFWKRRVIYKPEDAYPSEIENTYRRIRQSYEERRNYPEAGDFYYGEMDSKRKSSSARRYLPSLTTLFWISSGYGQRPFQAGLITLLLLSMFTGLFLLFGIEMVKNAPFYIEDTNFWTVFWFHTLRVATFLAPEYFKPQNEYTDIISNIARIVVPLQVALFFLSVKRLFKR